MIDVLLLFYNDCSLLDNITPPDTLEITIDRSKADELESSAELEAMAAKAARAEAGYDIFEIRMHTWLVIIQQGEVLY